MSQNMTISTTVDSVTADRNYELARFEADKYVYVGPDSTLSTRDDIALHRSYPKKAGNSQGIAEAYSKIGMNVSVPGVDVNTSVEQLASVELRFRMPAGMTDVEIELLHQKAIGLLSAAGFKDRFLTDLKLDITSAE